MINCYRDLQARPVHPYCLLRTNEAHPLHLVHISRLDYLWRTTVLKKLAKEDENRGHGGFDRATVLRICRQANEDHQESHSSRPAEEASDRNKTQPSGRHVYP
jgi:hypothetical protein